jgi:hypothetical protein
MRNTRGFPRLAAILLDRRSLGEDGCRRGTSEVKIQHAYRLRETIENGTLVLPDRYRPATTQGYVPGKESVMGKTNDAYVRAVAAGRGLITIAFWQFVGFFLLLLLIWVDQVLDLSDLFFQMGPTEPSIIRGCLLSAGVIITAIITVGHTYAQQSRIISGFVTVCASCHKVKIDKEVWERIEDYIIQHSPVEFSHGLCPDCYAREMSALKAEASQQTKP